MYFLGRRFAFNSCFSSLIAKSEFDLTYFVERGYIVLNIPVGSLGRAAACCELIHLLFPTALVVAYSVLTHTVYCKGDAIRMFFLLSRITLILSGSMTLTACFSIYILFYFINSTILRLAVAQVLMRTP